jgi:hypothetical protein
MTKAWRIRTPRRAKKFRPNGATAGVALSTLATRESAHGSSARDRRLHLRSSLPHVQNSKTNSMTGSFEILEKKKGLLK